MMNATSAELLELKKEIETQYSGSAWFKSVTTSSDDGGPHLEFRVTDMDLVRKDKVNMHFKVARVIFISVGKPVVRA